ncbi:MAG: primosomal protein N' [Bacteroidota bacterium]
MVIAKIILPVPVKSNFDYLVPPALEERAEVGMRALVTFGRNKMYTGVIKSLREESEDAVLRKLKQVDDFPDDRPVLRPLQLQLFEWIAYYYFCTEGEVLKASLPAGLKLESEVTVESAQVPGWEELELTPPEYDLLSILRGRPWMTVPEVGQIWNIAGPLPRLRNMEARGLVRIVHRLKDGYKPKTEKYVELAPEWQDEEALHGAFGMVGNAPRQEEVLMLVVESWFKKEPLAKKALRKRIDGSDSGIKGLIKKGILLEIDVPVDRVARLQYRENKKDIELNAEQVTALEKIQASFVSEPNRPVLLHGVTGSGKTHLYIELIREALDRGEEVLYLLPEIALTQQIIDKIKSEFGEKVGVYHSRFNDNERVEIWQKVLVGDYAIVIGVRSAIFLPFAKLGLIVVDEEHDHSFKQNEPNPRYNARDIAVYCAHLLACRVLLGSATPSFESFQNASLKKYALATIHNRAVKSELPQIAIVDMREQRKKRLGQGHFSQPLLDAVRRTLERREQAILFQNRRGFVPWLTCMNCGHVPRCINCDISLTYHKAKGQLRCHYCGYTDHEFAQCEKCGSYDLKQQGIGTERIEEELKALFPEARIARMDLDTTRSRNGFLKLIRSFEKHEIDILVGTQMVSKGLDFENVTLVGVIEADLMLNFADFRAYERAYQLLTQVSGRAGRAQKKGQVLIQTFMPDNPVLKLLQQPYTHFFDLEMPNRKALDYPPYTRVIRLELRHKNQLFLETQAEGLRNILLPTFGRTLLGPEYPMVTRLRNEYRQIAMLKLPRNASVGKVRKVLAERIAFYYKHAPKKTLRILVDVDPM